MRVWLRVSVTAIAEVLLVAGHTAAAVPASLSPVCNSAPGVIMITRFFNLMTFGARVLLVACEALGIPKFRFKTVIDLPVDLMCGVHRACLDMANAAILKRSRLIVVAAETSFFQRQYVIF